MALEKITEAQMDAKGVISAPNILNGSAAANKAVFDRMVRELVAPAYNACVDAVNKISGMEEGVAANEKTRQEAETNRERAEETRAAAEQERVTAEAARQAAEEQRQNLEQGYVAQARNAAKEAESWTKGGTGTRQGEDTDNAKYYAQQAKEAAGGDFVSNSEKGKARGVATLDETGKVPASQLPDAEYIATTMMTSGWNSNTYSFEANYPRAQYDIEIMVADTATAEQFEAFAAAMIGSSAASNIATAIGEVPTVDIPIIIKAVRK